MAEYVRILGDIPEDFTEPSETPKQTECDELNDIECDILENLKLRRENEELQQFKEVHYLRKAYLRVAFAFVALVSATAFTALYLGGGFNKMTLAPSVLITLLSTTLANVIGVLYIAFNWLFPKNQQGLATEL